MVLQVELLLDSISSGKASREEIKRSLSHLLSAMMQNGELLRKAKKAPQI